MKTIFYTLLGLSLGFSACSDSKLEQTPDNKPVDAVAIHLSQQLGTRAVVKDGDDLTASVFMCDGEGAKWDDFKSISSNTINDDKKLILRANTSEAKFKASTAVGSVELLPVLYHNNQSIEVKSWLKAISPKGSLSGATITFDASDGSQDIIFAPSVDAGTQSDPKTVVLLFEHKTSQLSFEIKLKPYSPANGGSWNGKAVSLKSVKLQSAALPLSFDIMKDEITWSALAPFEIKGIDNPKISDTATSVGHPVMINASAELYIDAVLTLEGGTNDIICNNIPVINSTDINKKLETKIGESHLVTITVVEPCVAAGSTPITSIQASIQEWKAGTSGSVTLE